MTCQVILEPEKGEVNTKCPVPEKKLDPTSSIFKFLLNWRLSICCHPQQKRYNRQPTTASLPSRNAPRHPTHRHIGQSCVLSRCVLFLPSNVTM
ncbi:hypothetical protein CEXT_225681 [Caerostris extrusa]|uniref:Uncharacterized protein n=1 Tax=Caerostris extrusa TaxID=172846 RepID=A0AAV4W4H0_CAEEX|nr:hypothetical protein CEXT_225681 [Caerostris extrusa]